MNESPHYGKYLVWSLVVVLLIIHQDLWFWHDGTLVFGFVPIGLFYHACLSVAASIVWFLATKYAWPTELIEQVVEETQGSSSTGESA